MLRRPVKRRRSVGRGLLDGWSQELLGPSFFCFWCPTYIGAFAFPFIMDFGGFVVMGFAVVCLQAVGCSLDSFGKS